jgi:hypothetical protein
MAQLEPIDLSQTEDNALTKIGDEQRKKLFPRNDYNIANKYSSVNPDAIANGDVKGKGTGGDLDVYNDIAGNIDDNLERKKEVVINKYNQKKTYPDF